MDSEQVKEALRYVENMLDQQQEEEQMTPYQRAIVKVMEAIQATCQALQEELPQEQQQKLTALLGAPLQTKSSCCQQEDHVCDDDELDDF